MKRLEYVQALRELADFIESKSLPDKWKPYYWSTETEYPSPEVDFTVTSKEKFGEIVAALGSFEKVSTDNNVCAIVRLPSGASVTARIAHEQVCERVVVGKKTVPFKQAYFVEAEPEHEEDVVEWKCPESFIALKGETSEQSQ